MSRKWGEGMRKMKNCMSKNWSGGILLKHESGIDY